MLSMQSRGRRRGRVESPRWACGAHSKCPDGSPCSRCIHGEPRRGRGWRSTQKLLGAIKAQRPPSPCFCFQTQPPPTSLSLRAKARKLLNHCSKQRGMRKGKEEPSDGNGAPPWEAGLPLALGTQRCWAGGCCGTTRCEREKKKQEPP